MRKLKLENYRNLHDQFVMQNIFNHLKTAKKFQLAKIEKCCGQNQSVDIEKLFIEIQLRIIQC